MIQFSLLSCLFQGYPGQQYIQGGQYPTQAGQYAPSALQPAAPSPSYPGHRMSMQQGMSQYLSASGTSGPYYKVPGFYGNRFQDSLWEWGIILPVRGEREFPVVTMNMPRENPALSG